MIAKQIITFFIYSFMSLCWYISFLYFKTFKIQFQFKTQNPIQYCIMQLPSALFSSSPKNKKICSKKISYIFLYFEKWNFQTLRLKKLLYFLKKKLFLYFGKWNFLKNLLIFQDHTFKLKIEK